MKGIIFLCLCVAMVTCDPLAPLFESDEPVSNRYIVKIKEPLGRAYVGGEFQERLAAVGLRRAVRGRYDVIDAILVDIPEDKLALVRGIEGVEYVEQDSMMYPSAVGSWGLDRIDQHDLPLDGTYDPQGDGEGVDVYVIDTGILYSHEEFEGRAHFGYDFIDDGRAGLDCNGHGTHCAGTVGGKTYGVAKNATLWSVRVFACSGGTPKSVVMAAMEWVIGHASGSAIVSMSLGGSASVSQNNLVSKMHNAGLTVVVAAGNSYMEACKSSPASAAKAITVGSMTDTDARSYFSNYGTCVDIFAPGSSILSAGIESDREATYKSGTSMACPHVAGAAALELGRNPKLSPAEIADILTSKAVHSRVANAGPHSPNLLLRI